ncbi:PLP-dependent transferase [Pseudomonas sp. GW6]
MDHDTPHSRDFDASAALHVGRGEDFSDTFCEPLAMTSAYTFASARDAWEKFTGQQPGNVYSRFTNPTVRAFERRIASLEGGRRCGSLRLRYGGDSRSLPGAVEPGREHCLQP